MWLPSTAPRDAGSVAGSHGHAAGGSDPADPSSGSAAARHRLDGGRRTGPAARLARRLAAGALVGLLIAAGCDAGSGGGAAEEGAVDGLTRDEFVEVVVELREAEREAQEQDSTDSWFRDRKEEILEERGVTETQLRDYLLAHGEDMALLEALWDSINEQYAAVT